MNKVHFMVFSPTGSTNRQFSISKALLKFVIVFFVLATASLGYIIPDYTKLKYNYIKDINMHTRLENQDNKLEMQKKQIKHFAEIINDLKYQIVYLNNFEKKIRTVAKIDMTTQKSAFGVGGNIPEDLDPNAAITKQSTTLIREMNSQAEQLKNAALYQEKRFGILLESLEERRDLLASTPSIKPTKGWVSSSFGYRVSPFTGAKEFHRGIDIANHLGTKIMAPATGLVIFTGKRGGYGVTLTLDHSHGMVTRYAHLKKVLVEEGDLVKRGDVIAIMGSTGRSTGPHLHYEVRLNGIPVNPEKYILN